MVEVREIEKSRMMPVWMMYASSLALYDRRDICNFYFYKRKNVKKMNF